MRNTHFSGSLNMTQTIFDRLDVRWNDINKNLICDESVYISLINNFKNLGRYQEADDCIYQYGKYRLSHYESTWSRFTDIISWITCGFGVRPHFAIGWAVLLILLFGSIYYFFDALQKDDQIKNISQERSYRKQKRAYTFPQALYFSTMVFLVSLSPQGLSPAEKWRYAVMVEDILGWFLMTLFVVTLGHVMIR